MRRILCYGDSNTWGYDAAADDRFPEEVRWTGVLQQLLGEGFRVIEEGQPGRTTVWDDPIEEHRNGKTALYSVLESQSPVDLVVLMLGTNDLKPRFSLNAFDIAAGLERLRDWVDSRRLVQSCRSTAGFDWARYLSQVPALTHRQRQLALRREKRREKPFRGPGRLTRGAGTCIIRKNASFQRHAVSL